MITQDQREKYQELIKMKSNTKYSQWIEDYLKNNNPRGKCKEATEAMNNQFPELKKIRGHVRHILSNDLSSHWWLVDIDGNIIDPTSVQFVVIIEYTPFDESQPEPTGRCPNCGEYCYDYKTVCSEKCAEEYTAYLNGVVSF